MVIGKILQQYEQERQYRKYEKLLKKGIKKDALKLKKKDFLIKWKKDPIIIENDITTYFSGLENFYDAENNFHQTQQECENDALKMSKVEYVKKHLKIFYIDGKKMSREQAEKLAKPTVKSFFLENTAKVRLDWQLEDLESGKRKKDLETKWEKYNKNNTSKIKLKKTSSLKGNNITDELKELKKLYKSGDLSKEQFEKAKDKLLK